MNRRKEEDQKGRKIRKHPNLRKVTMMMLKRKKQQKAILTSLP
jgi:hypothetical protein